LFVDRLVLGGKRRCSGLRGRTAGQREQQCEKNGSGSKHAGFFHEREGSTALAFGSRSDYSARAMRIAKPILLTSTPVGVIWGMYEAFKVRWWLGGLMAVLIGVIGGFSWLTVRTIRRER